MKDKRNDNINNVKSYRKLRYLARIRNRSTLEDHFLEIIYNIIYFTGFIE